MAYVHGQWNAICDQCGFEFKSRQLRLQSNGLRTCYGAGTTGCWDPKHPLETPRPVPSDRQRVPWVRPDDTTFVQQTHPDWDTSGWDVIFDEADPIE